MELWQLILWIIVLLLLVVEMLFLLMVFVCFILPLVLPERFIPNFDPRRRYSDSLSDNIY